MESRIYQNNSLLTIFVQVQVQSSIFFILFTNR